MKKKVLALLLCAVMTASLIACGESDDQSSEQENSQETDNQQQEEVTPEALPKEFAHITFDEGANEGYTVVGESTDGSVPLPDGAPNGRAIVESSAILGYADGPVGQALYLDGKHGLNLHLEPTNTDTWTVSYWVNGDRFANAGATLQIGYNVGRAAGAGNNVTWMNITQWDWGANSAPLFPLIWSRNEASDGQDVCFPWMAVYDDAIGYWDNAVHGKKEWVMITVVASGEQQTGPESGATTCGAQLYLNGALVYDSAENFEKSNYFEYTWDATLAPNIMKPGNSEFESWFGINYWDPIYKGFVDDLWVFDTALNAGQVASLYALGDPNVNSVAPETISDEEETPANTMTTGNSPKVGAEDCTTEFWKLASEGWAVASGESVSKTFVNWHGDEAANWNNFLIVLTSETSDLVEENAYAVVRSDNWGWKWVDGVSVTAASGELGWTVESDWNWDNFAADLQGATVTVTVTNNGGTADIECQITSADGNTSHYQNYKNIAVDGDLYFYLTVDRSWIDIQ